MKRTPTKRKALEWWVHDYGNLYGVMPCDGDYNIDAPECIDCEAGHRRFRVREVLPKKRKAK